MILLNSIIGILLITQFHNASSKSIQVVCEALTLTSYDCSGKDLDWRGLEESLIEPTRVAETINFSFNKFSPKILNYTFNAFKLLVGTVNLTGNNLEKIESHAFFFDPYTIQSINNKNNLKPLMIKNLDLSKNNFQAIPWNSIKYLENLKELYLNDNQLLRKLNSDELSDTDSESFFSLTDIHLRNCGIDYVEAKTLENFKKLEFLDLSSNRLHNLDQSIKNIFVRIMQMTGKSVTLKLKNNPLNCNCKLLWLKDYLRKNGHDKPTCSLDRSISHDLHKTSLVKTVAVDLVNNPNKEALSGQLGPASLEPSFIDNHYKSKLELTELDDSLFVCEIEFVEPVEPLKWYQVTEGSEFIKISLTCVAQGYPRPEIRWNENNKSLDKKSEYKTWAIQDKIINDKLSMFTVESTLEFKLSLPIMPSLFGYKNYSCKAMLNTEAKNKILHSLDKINPIDLVQKVIDFKVYHGVDLVQIYAYDPEPTDVPKRLSRKDNESTYAKFRERPLIYWIILIACILFILVIVLFSTYCIVHNNHKSAKMREELAFLGQTTYSDNKRSLVYLTNPRTPKSKKSSGGMGIVDKSILVPLKPDNIRDHQEYYTIYNNQACRTPSKDESVHYSNMNFASPSSILMKEATELLDQVDGNQSFDEKPTQSSPIDSESDDGLKSCDENIVDYQDPELIDLRGPRQKNRKP